MGKSITVPVETIQCLRGHLTGAYEILHGLGVDLGSAASERQTPESKPKKTIKKSDRVANYKDMLSKGKRGTKPKL